MIVKPGFRRRALAVALATAYGVGPQLVWANPTGAQVVSGQVAVQAQGRRLTVTNTPGAIINWQSFNIGLGETTYFQQQNAASTVLNRVQASNPNLKSQIDGTLGSNGRVFLINPNGMVFGAGSVIDTQGFVASTLNINDEDFRSGRLKFASAGTAGSIQANGAISSGSGDVYLVAPNIGVDGRAVITSSGGNVVLAAGEMVEITGRNLNDIVFAVQSRDNQAINLGTLSGGAVGVFAGTLSHSGAIQAQSLARDQGGQLVLKALGNVTLGAGSRTLADGQVRGGAVAISSGAGNLSIERDALVSASGAQGGSVLVQATKIAQDGVLRADGLGNLGGLVTVQAESRLVQTASALVSARGVSQGGDIHMSVGIVPQSAGHVFTSGSVDASATSGVGGTVTITGNELVFAAASVAASGDAGGGLVRIGGGRGGLDTGVDNAQNVVVTAASRFEANARLAGNGGTVVTWADGRNQFAGNVEARGGANSGNGGFIEVSGKQETQFGGIPNASAPHGTPGTFLLDPKYILIQAAPVIPGVSVELIDPNPGSGNFFGSSLNNNLASGHILVLNYLDDFAGADSGAVYLYNGTTGALISSLRGSQAGDQVGSGSIVRTLGGGNILLGSPSWNSSAGALTTFNTTTGVSGTVSSANSLVGATANDRIGSSGTIVAGTKIAILSPHWSNAGQADAGAITWADPTTGITGVVSAANSLVGDVAGDLVGNAGLQSVNFGNSFFALTANWHGNRGALTWIDGAAPRVGTINSTNSLVGDTAGDQIGSQGIYNLNAGKSLLFSPSWNSNRGAVTWVNQDGTTTGVVGSANSLVGVTAGDRVGSDFWDDFGVGQIAIGSPNWSFVDEGGTHSAAGAVTWATRSTALTGLVSSANSLVGTHANDRVSTNLRSLDGTHYLLLADNNAGSATWFDSAAPVTGLISSANSLVGSVSNDRVGSSDLYNIGGSKSLLFSPLWGGNKGAVTWIDHATGITGFVSSTNSLVGATAGDSVGSNNFDFFGATKLAILSPSWQFGGSVANAGAITWANVSGMTGEVNATNSLVGSNIGDRVGNNGVNNLDFTRFSVATSSWNSGRGAVTWVDSASPVTGPISSTNSLTGVSAGDNVGGSGLDFVGGGHYIVRSPSWGGNKGAVTWFDIAAMTAGEVSSSNSLVGTTAGTFSTGDRVGNSFQVLDNNRVALRTPNWNNIAVTATLAGAITFADAATGITGEVSSVNSLVGTTTNDRVGNGGFTNLGSGKYYTHTTAWGANAGALTWIDTAAAPLTGALTTNNSLLGSAAGDRLGSDGISNLFNGKRLVFSPRWNGNRGAVTWFDDAAGTFGFISSANSLVGTTVDDFVGDDGFTRLGSKVAIFSSLWNNGAVADAGAITWADATTGITGEVSALNSLVGTTAADRVGANGLTFTTGTHYLVRTQAWSGNTGAITWIDSAAPLVGAITSGNSLVGAAAGDRIGSGGTNNFGTAGSLVFSPEWNGTRGAVTLFNNVSGSTGIVGVGNSLVGSTVGDRVGSGGSSSFGSRRAIESPDWNNGGNTPQAGAITWVDLALGFSGAVTSANSLVGTQANDRVGNGSLQNLNGTLWAATTTSWNGNRGAVTWINNASPLTGAVSSANSLVGSTAGDLVGNNGFANDVSGFEVLLSTSWNSSRGAVTYISYAAPTTGVVSDANSLVGANANDRVGNGGVNSFNNGDYYVRSISFASNAGAISVGSATAGISGVVSGANSLVGQVASDFYASSVTELFASNRLLVRASSADSGGFTNNGRVHLYSGGAGGGGGAGGPLGAQGYADNPGSSVTITPGQITAITNGGTNVVLQASTDITLAAGSDIITVAGGTGGDITLQAGRSVLLNSSIVTDNGDLLIVANDRVANGVQAGFRDAGVAEITMANGTLLNAGTGSVTLLLRDGQGHSGAITAADTTGQHFINMRSITAGNLLARTDFGGIKVGDPGATLASDINIANSAELIAATTILFAGGGQGAFAQLQAAGQITIDPPSLEMRNGGSFARIANTNQLHPLILVVSDCIGCTIASPYEITGRNNTFIDGLIGQVGDGGFDSEGGGGGGFKIDAKDKTDDIAVDAGETCK